MGHIWHMGICSYTRYYDTLLTSPEIFEIMVVCTLTVEPMLVIANTITTRLNHVLSVWLRPVYIIDYDTKRIIVLM